MKGCVYKFSVFPFIRQEQKMMIPFNPLYTCFVEINCFIDSGIIFHEYDVFALKG